MGKITLFGLSPGTGRETVAATGGRSMVGMTPTRLWLLAAILFGLAMTLVTSGPNSKADAQTSGTAKYTVTDLGTLAGQDGSGAEAINESGQVVGWSGFHSDSGSNHGFIWQNGQMTDLGTLGGEYSYAYDINDSGQVVGESDLPDTQFGNGSTHAFLWQNSTMTDLGALLDDPDDQSHAYAINNSGQVVGESTTYHPDFGYPDHAFLYSNGVMQDLGILGPSDSPGSSVAYSINGTGEVVGEADLEDFMGTHAFLSDNGSPMADLGTLNGSNYSVAYDINDSSQVVGESQGDGFLWQNGTMSPLGDIEPAAVNNDGQVVGSRCVFDGGEGCSDRATIFENGQTEDLNDLIDPASGWTLSEASDINDEGQIVGTGTVNGETRAFLLTPDATNEPPAATDDTYNVNEDGTLTADGQNGNPNGVLSNDTDSENDPLTAELVDSPTNAGSFNFDSDGTFTYVPAGNFHGSDSFTYKAKDANGESSVATVTINVSAVNDPPIFYSRIADQAIDENTSTENLTFSITDNEVNDANLILVSASSADAILVPQSGIEVGGTGSFRYVKVTPAQNEVGTTTITVTLTDPDGATSTDDFVLTVNPAGDQTPPGITITSPVDGAEYKLGQVVTADYSCSDGGSGVQSCVGSVPDGDNIDTASVGPKTFTVNAADVDGNTASASHDYSVVYDFGNGSGGGFLAPVDNFPALNSMKAGATVPVKFALGGDQGLDIFAEDYPLSRKISCATSLPVDPIEETVAASNSGLKYDAATGHYSYNWKTEKGWSGTCRQLVIKLKDGTEHPLNFQFK